MVQNSVEQITTFKSLEKNVELNVDVLVLQISITKGV